MAKRITIGIVYSYDENWIGGTYYYQNLIHSLNLLPDSTKPSLIILSKESSSFDSIKELNYPFVEYEILNKKKSFLKKYGNLLLKKIFSNKEFFLKKIDYGIDVLFHPSEISIPNKIKKHLYWIPDFQELHLPHLFSQEYLDFRKKSQLELLSNDKHILFSSNDAFNDFKKEYSMAKSKCYIVNFSVFHPDFSTANIQDIKSKYKINNDVPYFFSPNQFWKHKNHIVILKAVKKIKERFNWKFQIIFSGKEFDQRNPTYFNELKEFVVEHSLQKYIRFLGFIDRGEQLSLMKNALVVIQPSLFEGWSTVIEDAKAMNQNLIVSSLNVHKEQLGNQAYYFDPNDEEQLIDHILFFLSNSIEKPEFNYKERLKLFGEDFMKVIIKI